MIKAIAYIHNLNPPIFHGDIKPSNLLITKVGYNVKLCDFASKICFKYAGKQCFPIAKLPYCSPNLYLNGVMAKESDDVWALGTTLIFSLKGTEPWFLKRSSNDDEEIERIEKKMKNKEKPESFKILDHLQQKLLAKCFEYDENCRIKAIELLSLFIDYKNRITFESQYKV